jgi:hypothetical protein
MATEKPASSRRPFGVKRDDGRIIAGIDFASLSEAATWMQEHCKFYRGLEWQAGWCFKAYRDQSLEICWKRSGKRIKSRAPAIHVDPSSSANVSA